VPYYNAGTKSKPKFRDLSGRAKKKTAKYNRSYIGI
jgi:hypothetical protein